MFNPKFLKLIALFLITILLVSFDLLKGQTLVKKQSVGKVTFPLGFVLVLKKGETRFRSVTFNMPISEGDKFETKRDSRCELTFYDGNIIRFAEQSIYIVENAQITDTLTKVDSRLYIGRLWANVKKLVDNTDSWNIKTPVVVIKGEGAVFYTNAHWDSSTQVCVHQGTVAVSHYDSEKMRYSKVVTPGSPRQIQSPVQVAGPKTESMLEWTEIIKVGQQILVNSDGTYTISDCKVEDEVEVEWIEWNIERDK